MVIGGSHRGLICDRRDGQFDIIYSTYVFLMFTSLSMFFYFIENYENTIVEFLFCYLSKIGLQKNIFVVLSHSLLFK